MANRIVPETSAQTLSESSQMGFMVLAFMSVFVALWMCLQGQATQAEANSSSIQGRFEEFGKLNGVKNDFLYMPDDALLGFVEVLGGPFTMGSNPVRDRQAYENERWSQGQRQGTLEIETFYISRFETTIAQYAAFVDEAGMTSEEAALQGNPYFPVVGVTWAKAVAYTKWLDSKLRLANETPAQLKNALDAGAKVMLPTEAQWEKAARGTDSRIYPWGNTMNPEYVVYNTTSVAAVGSKPCEICAHGLADMSGNVWEFTRSPMQPYPYDGTNDAEDLSADALYVMRGGSFSDQAGNIRTATRGGVDPGVRNNSIGFRVIIGRE